jgi:hypothetical protein
MTTPSDPPSSDKQSGFAIPVPSGYIWLRERGLIQYLPGSVLQPWYFLGDDEMFDVTREWPSAPSRDQPGLVAFARRQDNDEIACFRIGSGGVDGVVLIQGWTDTGYELRAQYHTFWGWLKAVIDNIADSTDSAELS